MRDGTAGREKISSSQETGKAAQLAAFYAQLKIAEISTMEGNESN